MESGTEAIYQELIRVAKNRDITYYSSIDSLAGLDVGSGEDDRYKLNCILREIDRTEFDARRPLLCAVVVQRMWPNIPRRGFFGFARELGVYDGSGDVQFWTEELRRVHEHWGRQA